MTGKVLKISSNDLYGNVDDRLVRVYVCFTHTKYMNNYVVFSFEGSNKLCFGSIHLKEKSLVIFSVKDAVKKYILAFLEEYMNDKLEEFEIINIDKISKVELVSNNEMEYDKLTLLDDKAIKKVVVVSDNNDNKKKPVFLYFILFILILISGGLTLLYFKPELFTVTYKGLDCSKIEYDNTIGMDYYIERKLIFDLEDEVESISVTRVYTFSDTESYNEFKDNNTQNKYFTNGETYKYIDEELQFKLFYSDNSVIDDYDEMYTYLNREGYSCIERVYEK